MGNYIQANWPAPDNIHAFTGTRQDGFSQTPFDSFNVASHVGDDSNAVRRNRQKLKTELSLPEEPRWLSQTHSTIVLQADTITDAPEGDASFTKQNNTVCAVLTGDCLPILICNKQGNEIAAIHAGWKGLADGILEETLEQLQSNREDLLVWFGPAISPKAFEVQQDVLDSFLLFDENAINAFEKTDETHWQANIYQLARQRCQKQGVQNIFGGDFCTFSDPKRFYSARRDKQTGRMVNLIWMD